MPTDDDFRFKQAVPVEERRRQVDAQMKANPNFITVVCEALPGDVCAELLNPLLVVPVGATIGDLAALLKVQIPTERRVVLRVHGKPCRPDKELGGLHEQYRDPEDHCLYVRYSTSKPERAISLTGAFLLATVLGSAIIGVVMFSRRRRRWIV